MHIFVIVRNIFHWIISDSKWFLNLAEETVLRGCSPKKLKHGKHSVRIAKNLTIKQ